MNKLFIFIRLKEGLPRLISMKKYFIIVTILLLAAACNKQPAQNSQTQNPPAQNQNATSTPSANTEKKADEWQSYQGRVFSFKYPPLLKLFTYNAAGAEMPVYQLRLAQAGIHLGGGATLLVDKTLKTELSEAVMNEFFNVVPPKFVEKIAINHNGSAGFKIKVLNNKILLDTKTWYYFETLDGVYEVVLTNEDQGKDKEAKQAVLDKIFESLKFD